MQILPGEPRIFERLVDRAFAQFLCNLEPGGVCLAPGGKLRIALEWKGQMTEAHARARMEPFELFGVRKLIPPIQFQGAGQYFLRVTIFGKGACYTTNSHWSVP